MYRRILVASDGSPGAAKAVQTAILLARRFKAELHMIRVEDLPGVPATVDEVVEEKSEANHRFEAVVAAARVQARSQRVKREAHVVAGRTVPRVVELVERGGFDLLVVGFMGHSALYNRLIGSTTDRVVELAPCHVLVAK
jgi:nucleotide-binding universal stress UspA family protein